MYTSSKKWKWGLLNLFLYVVPLFHNLLTNIFMIFIVQVNITKMATTFAYRPLNKRRELFGRAKPRYFDGKGICKRFDIKSHASTARRPFSGLPIFYHTCKEEDRGFQLCDFHARKKCYLYRA